MLLYLESSEVPASRERTVPVIATENLVKRFGAIQALAGVTLTVERGQIFGLLGQNGAGKTTLIKILLGVTKKTEGRALLLDQPAGAASARRRVGYLPEDHRFPDYHTAASLLDFYGALLDVPGRVRRQRIPEILEVVGLKGRMHYKIRTYSKGMKQRLGIAQALMHQPDVIFLDEPTDGVDPVGRREIRDIMQSLKAEGKTIFLNSHLLSEVEQICDRVAILAKGELVREGDIAALTKVQGFFLIGLAARRSVPGGGRGEARLHGAVHGRVLRGRADRRAEHRSDRRDAARARPQAAAPRTETANAGRPVRADRGVSRAGRRSPPGAGAARWIGRPGRPRPGSRNRRRAAWRLCAMKFLAILKDSFREAIDAKVFYVMVGLSLLLTLVAFTLTFTPTASGERLMQFAAAPLNLDAEDLAEMNRNPEEFTRRVTDQVGEGKRRVAYALVSTHPAAGAPDAPGSPFQVVVSATYLFPKDAEKIKEDPAEAIDHIRQRFGAYDNLKIVEAAEVRRVDRPAGVQAPAAPLLPFLGQPQTFYFEVTTRPTAATPRFWWHNLSLFFGALPIGGRRRPFRSSCGSSSSKRPSSPESARGSPS